MNIQNLSNKFFRGYISSRDINGLFYPQSIQNLLIRNYCKDKNLNLQLSGTEWIVPKSFTMLRTIIDEKNDGVIFFSIFQIFEDQKIFMKLSKSIINKKKIMIFCLENLIISNNFELNNVYNSMKIISSSKANSTESAVKKYITQRK